MVSGGKDGIGRGRALAILAVITAAGAALRFYGLGWGAPYYHFHIDEHFVFSAADMLRRNAHEAAMSSKFFMYGPLPAYVLDAVRWVYERMYAPLVLSTPRDEITYMVLGRAISATMGTLQIPVVYAIATRVAGRRAGLLAAAFLAAAVVHLRESHFFSVDSSMTFFVVLTWWAILATADSGGMGSRVASGITYGCTLVSKYSGAFMGLPMGIAHLLAPDRPKSLRAMSAWVRWVARGISPLVVTGLVVLVADSIAFRYWQKFKDDIRVWVVEPLTGQTQFLWTATFYDVTSPHWYWFTNLLWWGLGPAMEAWALVGVAWLLVRRTKAAFLSAIVPITYFVVAGNTTAPFMRYVIPLIPALAVSAGVLSADAIRTRALRMAGIVLTSIVLGTTALYAAAYMNVYRQEDSRVTAARYISRTVPDGAPVLVEPSQILPPMGSYFGNTDFNVNYQPTARAGQTAYDGRWNPRVHLIVLDTYHYLYDPRVDLPNGTRGSLTDAEKRAYIAAKVAEADWIITDDSFLEFYAHLPWDTYGPVKQYHEDLVAGRLGFTLDRSFKVYPALFGLDIKDESSELTFRLFDHPRVSLYRRTTPVSR
jgi:4-amino-4-deoxy-L-arabinose transferase-like glycosyltransferase